jgi:hypothetical protein
MANILLLIAAMAVCALVAGGVWLIKTEGNRTKGLLMIVTALVITGNMVIWMVPV